MLKAVLKINWTMIYDFKYVLHNNICTVFKIIPVIDYKGPNWIFLTLQVIFNVTIINFQL